MKQALPIGLLALGSFALPVASQVSLADQSAKVDQIMATRATGDVPGAAVMVILDGKVVHKKGYGLANVDAKTPIDEHTIFDLASVSSSSRRWRS